MISTDTIAAISTPYGKGGIAVIRISGSDAFEIADKVFVPKNKKKISETDGDRTVYGNILSDGEIIDDGIAAVFRAPRSFTGEDTVEISCHGGIVLTKTILEAVYVAGARPAEAGEFSKRAFLSGKISLSQAEAIINLIDAESNEKIRLSSSHSRGVLEKKTEEIRSYLTDVISSVYAYIDYPDEDLTDMTVGEMKNELLSIQKSLDELCQTYKIGHAVSEGIKTVIVGRPNTGKSSVLNRILGQERAIVTAVPGTTRDTVEETVTVGRVLIRLCDTAGIRETDDEVEKIGVERSRIKLSEAELVLAVFDGSSLLTDEDKNIIHELRDSNKTIIPIINKNDLEIIVQTSDIEVLGEPIFVSANSGDGFDELKKTISDLFVAEKIDYDTTPVLSGARQYAAAKKASEYIGQALSSLENGFTQDVSGMDMESALSSLGELDGRSATEEITSKIFSRFCVGK